MNIIELKSATHRQIWLRCDKGAVMDPKVRQAIAWSIDRQAAEVDRVKRSESGMIRDPIRLPPDALLRDAVQLMAKVRISGLPVVAADGTLVGIITNRDLQFERSLDRPLKEAMTAEGLITAPQGTTLDDAERLMAKHRIEKLPVVDGKGHLIGLITVKDIHKRRQYPMAAKDQHGRLMVAAAIGAGGNFLDRARALVDAGDWHRPAEKSRRQTSRRRALSVLGSAPVIPEPAVAFIDG